MLAGVGRDGTAGIKIYRGEGTEKLNEKVFSTGRDGKIHYYSCFLRRDVTVRYNGLLLATDRDSKT